MERNKWVYDKQDKRLYTMEEWKAIQEKRSPKMKVSSDAIKTWEYRESLKHKRWIYCQVQKKVVPYGQHKHKTANMTLANVAHGYIPDEMGATKHPVNKKHYTSKSKFRAETKAHGREEVGTAYENGYDPFVEAEKERERKYAKERRELLREHLNSERIYRH